MDLSRVWLVTEYGNGYHKHWGVCATYEIAKALEKKIYDGLPCKISREKYKELMDNFYKNVDETDVLTYEEIFNIIHYNNPEYSVSELKQADRFYGNYSDGPNIDVDIRTINLYNNINDL